MFAINSEFLGFYLIQSILASKYFDNSSIFPLSNKSIDIKGIIALSTFDDNVFYISLFLDIAFVTSLIYSTSLTTIFMASLIYNTL